MDDNEQGNDTSSCDVSSDYVKRISKYINEDSNKSLLQKARSIINMIQEDCYE